MAKLTKVKITDVAEYAGVSVSTVSLVLGNKGRISESTINKVNQAVEALGYVRNNAAANLRSNHSNLIGLILADITDPFYNEVTAGLSAELEKHDHMLFLAQSNHQADKLIQCVQSMIQQGVAGIAFSPVREATSQVLNMAKQAGIPAVCLARAAVNNDVDYIGPDNSQAAVLATQHLIEQGHRHIAYVGGFCDSLTRAERIGGYCTTLMQYGLPFKNEWVVETGNNQSQAADCVQQLLTQHPKITALLCHRPAIALGAIYGIQQVGKSVGKDNYIGQQVGLIGFDDTPEATLTQPTLTMISSPTRQIGEKAAQRLLVKMTNETDDVQRLILPPQLIERGSA
ncbi:Mal regulon transcriptional regulator MalI [Photobacterium leiognathi]|uniref:Mal regulon transcriptional regulator MalI n=1 Tax=Photobacterium leiognathi TaxID=553611 RepID=UPI002980BE27|nr:Mal regulon transcriptional regulator MalI [Photobacterium leiognathi]